MTMLVSLQQARDHLRSDSSDDDNDLVLKIHAASALVLDYVDADTVDYVDSSGNVVVDSSGTPTEVPFVVAAATLLLVGYLYRMRDNNEGGEFEMGYLPKPVTALLYKLRTPANG